MKKVVVVIICIILMLVSIFSGLKLKELYEYEKALENISLDEKEIEKNDL